MQESPARALQEHHPASLGSGRGTVCIGHTKYMHIPSWEKEIPLGIVTTKSINQLEELISCYPAEPQLSPMVVAASGPGGGGGRRWQLHPTCPVMARGGPALAYGGFVLGLRTDSLSWPKSRPKEVMFIPLPQESPFSVASPSTGTSAVATHTWLLPVQPPGRLAASGAVSQ